MLLWLVQHMRLLGLLRASAAADVLAEFVVRFNRQSIGRRRILQVSASQQTVKDVIGKYRNSS